MAELAQPVTLLQSENGTISWNVTDQWRGIELYIFLYRYFRWTQRMDFDFIALQFSLQIDLIQRRIQKLTGYIVHVAAVNSSF